MRPRSCGGPWQSMPHADTNLYACSLYVWGTSAFEVTKILEMQSAAIGSEGVKQLETWDHSEYLLGLKAVLDYAYWLINRKRLVFISYPLLISFVLCAVLGFLCIGYGAVASTLPMNILHMTF